MKDARSEKVDYILEITYPKDPKPSDLASAIMPLPLSQVGLWLVNPQTKKKYGLGQKVRESLSVYRNGSTGEVVHIFGDLGFGR